MRILNRFSALFLSVLLILTAVFIPSVVMAQDTEADPTESLLYGIVPSYSYYSNGGVMTSTSENTLTCLTDGNTTNVNHHDFYSADGKTFIWMLKERASINKIVLWESTNKNYEGTYEVYIGNNSADLFDSNNLVYTFSPNDLVYNEFTLGTAKVGALVGIKITDASEHDTSARIREFGVYGEAAPEIAGTYYVNKCLIMPQMVAAHAKSLIAGKTPYSVKNTAGTTRNPESGTSAASLTDGDKTGGCYANPKTDYSSGTFGSPVLITYDLSKVYEVTGFTVYGAHKDRYMDFSVYVGDDPETLYSGTPVYTGSTHSDTDGYNFGTEVLIAAGNKKYGQYVGFAITQTGVNGDSAARLKELQVFGKVPSGTVVEREATTSDTTTSSLIHGKEWAVGFFDGNSAGSAWAYSNTVSTYVRTSAAVTSGTAAQLSNGSAILTDGVVGTHKDLYDITKNGKTGAKLVWALDETSDITGFMLYNCKSYLNTVAYEVYASETLSGLYNADNIIYSFGFRDGSGNVIDAKAQQKGQYVTFTGDKVKKANYVAVWIHDTYSVVNGSPNSSTRISEIAFFGAKSEESKQNDKVFSTTRTTETSYEHFAAKLDAGFTLSANLLSNATLTVKDAGGADKSSGASERLTDGTTVTNSSTEYYATAYGENSFIFNLGGKATINGFMLAKSNPNFTELYKVYVGNNKDTLFSDDNLVFDMSDRTVATRVMGTAVKFAAAKTGKFFGIKFCGVASDAGTDNSLRIAEIAAFGQLSEGDAEEREATQADASANSLIYGKDWSFGVHDGNTKDGTWSYANTIHTNVRTSSYKNPENNNGIFKSGATSLTDGSAGSHIDLYDVNGTNVPLGAKLIWTLDKTSDITGFMIYNHKTYVNTVAYDVYASETLSGLFDPANVIYSFNFKDGSGNVITEKAEQKGQYVTFTGNKVKRANYVAVWIHDSYSVVNGSPNSGIRISEIGFFGTESQNAKTNDKITSIANESYVTWETISDSLGDADYVAKNNILKANKLTVKNASGTEVAVPSDAAQMTDGTLIGNNELFGSYLNYEFIYDLGSNTRLEALAHVKANVNFTEGYKIYASSNLSDLFTDANVVLDMSNTQTAARAMATAVKLSAVKECRYLGVKYLSVDGTSAGSSIRIGEIAAWGEQDDPIIDNADYTLTESDAGTMYEDNIIAGLEASWAGGGSNNGGNNPWSAGITDGNAGLYYYEKDGSQRSQKHYDLYNLGGTVELVYALEYEHNVEEIAVWEPHERKNGFDVYVSDSTKNLFDAGNKVASWSSASNPQATSIYLKIEQAAQKKGRYIGIKFTDYTHDASVRISEIYIGGTQTSWDNSGLNTAAGNSDIAKLYDNNLLTGRLPVLVSNPEANGGKTIQGEAMTGMLSDGSAAECEIYNAQDAKIYFDLGHPTVLSQIGLWMTNSAHRVSYKVYVGNDAETLFKGTHAYEWNALDDPSSMAQVYKFNSNAPVTARYVGFYFTDASSAHEEGVQGFEEEDNTEVRLAELYVGGVQDMSAVEHEALDSLDEVEGENLLNGFIPTLNGTAVSDSVAAALTDKAAATGAGIVVEAGDKLVYNIVRSANFEDIIISSDKTLGRYEVYVSDALDNLFKSVNCVYTTQNTADNSKITKISNPQENRVFLGIRVIDPSYDDSNSTVINEIVLTGAFNSYTTTYPDSSLKTTDYGESNLIEGLTPILKKLDGRDVIKTSSSASPLFTGKFNVKDENGNNVKWGPGGTLYHWWTDDRVGTGSYHPQVGDHVDIWGSGDGLTITYQLSPRDKFNISAVGLYNHRGYYLGDYEVYVSNSESTLYSPENKVIDFVNENQSWAQVMNFASDAIPVGKYVGFRFETPNYTGEGALRLSEIVVLGSKYDPKPTNLANTAGVKAYVEKNGVYTELSHAEFSTAQKKNFINDKNHDAITIDKQNGKLHFVIDLNAPMVIDTFRLENVAASNKRIKSLKVYAANFPDEVWGEDSLAFVYNKTASDGQTISINRKLEGRYIRVEVLDNGTSDGSFNLNHIALIGLDNQALDVSNQLYKISTNNITYYAQDNKTYEYESLFSTYKLQYLCDNTNTVAASIWGASRGNNGESEQSTNLIFTFTNAKSLSEIQVSSLIDKVYAMDDMEIYLGNSLNAVMDKSAKPIAKYYKNGKSENATRRDDGNNLTETTYFSFENTEALYIRLRINDSVDEVHGGSSKLVVLAEVKANGVDTANADIDASGEFSAQFTDSKTGITASFSRLGISDVYRGVTKMVVNRQKSTKEMADALAKTGFVTYGDLYAVEFYDYLGNRITDFGGRTVKFTVPFPSELGMAYLAGYYYGEFNLLNSGFEGSNIAYVYPELTPDTLFVLAVMPDLVPEEIAPLPTPDADDTIVDDTVITPDYDYDDDEIIDTDADADDEEEEIETKPQKKKRKKRIKKIVSGMSMTTIIIIIAACVVAAAAIAAAVIVIIRKKRILKN